MNEFASTSRSEFLVHDEWANDDVPFPTKSDALLATFALSKVADPVMVDNFFSLVMNPTFNPAECTLRTVTDIHSYACNYRKEIGNTISKDSSLSTIPPFVWQEVLLHIGAEYVAHACKLCDDAVHEAIGWNDGIFELESMCLESILDLRCASLVHRSWTGPAQRQLGRVLVLHNVNESTLTSAIRSTLYGNWTQILAMSGTGSIKDDNRWEGMDTLLPNLSYLKTFIARLPCLTMLHFESSVSSHPTVLFEAIKASVSPDTISIININDSVNHSTVDTLVLAQQHPGLRSLNLVGFRLDLNTPSSMEGLWSSSKSSQLSKIFISGSDYNLHPDALIQWVSWEKRALTGDSGKLTASEVKFRRAGGIYMHDHEAREDTDIPEDDNNVDFGALAQNHSLSWLPFIERIHLMNIHATEAEQILGLATAVRHLSWSGDGDSFTPTASLPPTVRGLHLFLLPDGDEEELWHQLDRDVHTFLRQKRNPSLERVTISVQIHENLQDRCPESEAEFPCIYFPRSSNLCKTLGISFSVQL